MGNKKKQTNEFDNYFDDDFEVVYEDLEDLGSYLSEDSSDNNNDYDDYDGYDGDTDYYDYEDDDDYDDYDDDYFDEDDEFDGDFREIVCDILNHRISKMTKSEAQSALYDIIESAPEWMLRDFMDNWI